MMLLRSSSTPILGSLLSAGSNSGASDGVSINHQHQNRPLDRTSSPSSSDFHKHLSFSSPTHHHSRPPAKTSLHSSSDRASYSKGAGGFQRASSDGNLQNLISVDHPSSLKSEARRPGATLKTISSFSVYSSDVKDPEEEEDEEEEARAEIGDLDGLERNVTIGEDIGEEFLFPGKMKDVGHTYVEHRGGDISASPLFLARGLGIDGVSPRLSSLGVPGDGDRPGNGSGYHVLTDDKGDRSDLEVFYRKMVEENPGDPLFLRNYAQFLYKTKGDPQKAEEYYSRAILAEPGDGEILSEYAKLVWVLHHDHEQASNYFEQAIQASPQDSHVLAAYASFMWETEDEYDDQFKSYDGPQISTGALASASA